MSFAQLPTDYQAYVHASRYARFRPQDGRREHWDETVGRYFDFFEEHLDRQHGYRVAAGERAELEQAVLGLQVMPSMRALMTAGEALRRENLAGFNCAYLPIDRPRAFAEALYVLMCGTGVGFSVERQIIARLPEVAPTFGKSAEVILVADSKRGWAEAYERLIKSLYDGWVPAVDYSLVRPAGTPLKVFGGRASGPEPLRALFEFTVRTFRGAAGRRLNSLECHELVTKTGEIVVVGGVRRSAEISLSNLSDQRMRDAKSGDWWTTKPHLALANNSVAYTEKPEPGAFMDEWSALYRSKSGERGIFNRAGAQAKIRRLGRRDAEHEFGTNPCVTGDTPLLTRRGYRPIREVVGQEVEIWNGRRWSAVTPFSTGVNPLVRVALSDGTHLTCTPYHEFVVQDGFTGHPGAEPYKVEARDLGVGQKLVKFDMPIVDAGVEFPVDAYSQGFYSGDGSTDLKHSWVYEPKMVCAERLHGEVSELTRYGRAIWKHGRMLPKDFVPLNGSLRYRRDWLAGLLDADGTVVSDKNGQALQLASIDLDFLQEVRLMLTTLGVQAKINLMHAEGRVHTHPKFAGYASKTCWRLLINQTDTYRLLHDIGVTFERLDVRVAPPQRDARRFVTVTEVTPLDHVEETFCVTEPYGHTATFNGIVTGNCGEIILRPRGLCNLTEAVIRPGDTVADLREKVRLAAILGTWQATLTSFNFVEPEWTANACEERLLGVSLTGIYDHALMRGDHGALALRETLSDLKAQAISANVLAADALGIPRAVAVTTVKPSGTVSQLVGCASGIHQGHARHYIRRIRADDKDPVTRFMAAAGVPHEPDVTKPHDMTVFAFPMAAPGVVTRDEVAAIEHLELVAAYNAHWSEHAVSCTVSIREAEWPAVGGWVYDHFDSLTGLSFLPHFEGDSSYAQMPYETIDADTYATLAAAMPKIDWSGLAAFEAGEDSVTATREFACVGGVCEILDQNQVA